MIHPIATNIPPTETINFGPRCGPRMSTIQPWMGVSHVSRAMKMVNATWIPATVHVAWASFSGLTNSVQPYCRLAIMIMQTMTDSNCVQRVAFDACAPTPAVLVLATLIFHPNVVCFCAQFSSDRQYNGRDSGR